MLELLQRIYLHGRLDFAYYIASKIIEHDDTDPLAKCLAGYTFLKTWKKSKLQKIFKDIKTDDVKYISDFNILLGEYMRRIGKISDSESCFRKSLDIGLPVFAEGLAMIYNNIRRYDIYEDKNSDFVKEISCSRIKGLLWSAWVPENN